MHEEHTARQHGYDFVEYRRPFVPGLDNRIGQSMYGRAGTDTCAGPNDVRFCRAQVDGPTANQYPAYAEHVRGRRIQAGSLDVEADDLRIDESLTRRRRRRAYQIFERLFQIAPGKPPTLQCEPAMPHARWNRLSSADWLVRTWVKAALRFCRTSGDRSAGPDNCRAPRRRAAAGSGVPRAASR